MAAKRFLKQEIKQEFNLNLSNILMKTSMFFLERKIKTISLFLNFFSKSQTRFHPFLSKWTQKVSFEF